MQKHHVKYPKDPFLHCCTMGQDQILMKLIQENVIPIRAVSSGQENAEGFGLMDNVLQSSAYLIPQEKLLLCLFTRLMSFPWSTKRSGKARIKKEVEININIALMQLKQLPSHSPNNLWILRLIKYSSKILNSVVLHSQFNKIAWHITLQKQGREYNTSRASCSLKNWLFKL